MGGTSSTPPPPPRPPTPVPTATRTRDFDRSFILFGKNSSGKSTLGNLILWETKFKVHKGPEAFGLTKDVQSGDTEMHPRIAYGEDCKIAKPLKIQILDQPGCNDSDFEQKNYCNFLMKCIAESKGEMCANFLILVNLKYGYLSPEEFLTFLNIAEILSSSNYSFFSNAVLVFTHADTIDTNLDEDKLEQELRKRIVEERFKYIDELIKLVEGRYIFINGANQTEENRYTILRKLFQLTRPNLKVYINGYDGFPGNEFKMLFRKDPSVSSFESKLLKCNVKYQFNPDLNLFRKHDKLDIEQRITQVLNRLSRIGKGISVIILLVNLEKLFDREVYNLFLNLPGSYRLGEEFKKDFWDYACILFKGPYDTEEFIQKNIDAIPLLKEFVKKVKSRYSSVSDQTSIEECSEKILGLVRKVKLDTEGKTYIDRTVLAEMNNIIKDSVKQREEFKYQEQMLDISNFKRIGIDIFKTHNSKVAVSLNDFFLSQKYISPQIGYFILKNINPEKADEFKAIYSEQRSVRVEEFSDYCHKALQNIPSTSNVIRDFDRSFILFGKSSSGKSTLANLILGGTNFKVHQGPEVFGLTKDVQSGDVEIHPRIIYGEDCQIAKLLKIQMLDQPGCNDSDFSQENLCNFLIKCIGKSKGEMNVIFLILINLTSEYMSPEDFLTILDIAETSRNYNFFSNAVLVFTFADKINSNLNEEKLVQELIERIVKEKFTYIDELIKLTNGRYIFINGANRTEENRCIILRKLFQLTRPNLKVYTNGFSTPPTQPKHPAQPSLPRTPIQVPTATVTRDFDRSFILFGKGSSGKSTLGNLILWGTNFKVHEAPEAFGLTKVVQSGDVEIHPRIIYGEDCQIAKPLKIQMLDQPGCNDCDFTQKDYCNFLMKCIAESKGEMSANFIILVNLKSGYLSPEEFLTILNIAEILSSSNYSFFSNAVLVFTHADKIDPNLNEEKLEQELRRKIVGEKFAYIDEFIKLVEGRYIFINGANHTEENRYIILRKLFQITRPNLKVYINGYDGFPGNEFKKLFKKDPSVNSFESNLLKYDVEYQFNPDLNMFRKYDKLDIEREITQALDRLSGIGKGVSVMILLVSLEEMFNKEVYNLILNLPETYRLGEKFKDNFWDYACILFKGPDDTDEFCKTNIDANPFLKEFVGKVKIRYSSVSEQTSIEECSKRILGLVRKVKLDTEGKTYIDRTVLAEMNNIIRDSVKQEEEFENQEQMLDNPDLKNVEIKIFDTKTTTDRSDGAHSSKVAVSFDNFFLSQKYISPQIGYYILKNINPEKAEEFKAIYSEQRSVRAEEFSDFCHKAL